MIFSFVPGRLAVITFSICTVVLGVVLSFVPWLDYIIFRLQLLAEAWSGQANEGLHLQLTFQHNKILRFVPELSTVTSFSPNMAGFVFNFLVSGLSITYRDRAKPFVDITAEELVFGYNDPLRNGTLSEVLTINAGQDMSSFGYLDKVNGLDHLTHWKDRP
ncbi:unnamed protein product [Leptidea sinapis]|uniref:Uncharacterized protein n=1 Tax=Leptidea sinapis TaxID=189913 RepID=A0A5E4QKR0_9NEOP|nr:unnamed protein product [Leptidea sinapis]